MITKIVIIIGAVVTGAFFLLPKHHGLNGTWVMDNKETNCEAAVIRIQMGEGYYLATLDMPEQQLYDKPLTLQIKNDSIKFMLDKKGDCFIQAVIHDSVMTGRSVVDGRSENVSFRRLSKQSDNQ